MRTGFWTACFEIRDSGEPSRRGRRLCSGRLERMSCQHTALRNTVHWQSTVATPGSGLARRARSQPAGTRMVKGVPTYLSRKDDARDNYSKHNYKEEERYDTRYTPENAFVLHPVPHVIIRPSLSLPIGRCEDCACPTGIPEQGCGLTLFIRCNRRRARQFCHRYNRAPRRPEGYTG